MRMSCVRRRVLVLRTDPTPDMPSPDAARVVGGVVVHALADHRDRTRDHIQHG